MSSTSIHKALWIQAAACILCVVSMAQQPAEHPARQMAGMRVWLAKSIDTRKLRQGDEVTARPEVKVRLANGLEFQQSTVLLGRVDEVQPSVAKSDSAFKVTFDTARMKDGRTVPIKATILWIAPRPNLLNPSVTSAPADRSTPGVGVAAGQSPATGASAPGAPATRYSAVEPPSPRDQGQTISALGNNQPPPPGTFRQNDGVPGISLESSVNASYSGIFRAAHQNINLPEGTVMALAVMVIAN